jgi:copper transport protein
VERIAPWKRLALVGTLATILLLVGASPASAHAQLQSTEPVGGTAGKAPERVVLRFNEPVEIALGSIRVYDGAGRRVDASKATHPGGDSRSVAADLPELDRGAYVVTWRATSADSHPVHGAFTFRVGPVPADDQSAALARRLLAAEGGSAVVGSVYALARLASYASLVLLVGGAAFLVLVWPAGATLRRVRQVLWGAWAGAVAATAAGIPLYAVYSGGLSLANVLKPSVVESVLDTRFGRMWSLRLILLVLALPVLAALLRRGPQFPRVLLGAGAVLGLAVLLTPGLAGHAATQDLVPLALATDVVHLTAVSLWLGGLALLVACVLPRREADELARVVPRFSTLAFASVVTISTSGLFLGWREVRSLYALTSTTYGRLLIVKVALFAGLVALGALSRRWVHMRWRAPQVALSPGPGAAAVDRDAETVARLRRTVGAEVVIAAGVLVVASLLVNAQPARSAVARPFSTELETKKLLIDVTIDPAKAGPLDVHVYTLSPAGAVQDVAELTAAFRLPDRDVGPLKVPLQRAGPGHFSAYRFELPLRGSWQLEVVARLTEFEQVRASAEVPVR